MPKESEKWDKYIDDKEISAWINDFPKREDYKDFMIEQLVIGVRVNSSNNDNKAEWIKSPTRFCLCGM